MTRRTRDNLTLGPAADAGREAAALLRSKAPTPHIRRALAEAPAGAVQKYRGQNDSTLLHTASDERRADVVAFLLEDPDAAVDARDARRFTPLHLAAGVGATDVARLLLEHGAEPGALDDEGRAPLHLACMLPAGRGPGRRRLLRDCACFARLVKRA